MSLKTSIRNKYYDLKGQEVAQGTPMRGVPFDPKFRTVQQLAMTMHQGTDAHINDKTWLTVNCFVTMHLSKPTATNKDAVIIRTYYLPMTLKVFKQAIATGKKDLKLPVYPVTTGRLCDGFYDQESIVMGDIVDWEEAPQAKVGFEDILRQQGSYRDLANRLKVTNTTLPTKWEKKIDYELDNYKLYKKGAYDYESPRYPDEYLMNGFPENKYACIPYRTLSKLIDKATSHARK